MMTANTLDCRVLLGWMSGPQAVHFLVNECRMDRNMSIGQAEDLWKEYRTRVEDLPLRTGAPVRTFELDAADRAIQQEFFEAHPEASDVTGFIPPAGFTGAPVGGCVRLGPRHRDRPERLGEDRSGQRAGKSSDPVARRAKPVGV
jgi:hypothetical protein